jgi:glyoxylase-like metal-dependent hydrolase (beta-lactamase superfamily II)
MGVEKPMGGFELFGPRSMDWINSIKKDGKVYNSDRFATVYELKKNVYSIYERSPSLGGDVWMHLILGPEKAMLIDTGFGIGNLKGLVNELAGSGDLITAITHPHGDHCGGNYQFGEVYCHKYAVPVLESQMKPHALDNFIELDKDGKGIKYDFDKSDIIPFKEYRIISCENNYIFNLGGGHEIELVHTPGHAPGGCCFIDRKNRILFSGDALVFTPVLIGGGPMRDGLPFVEYSTVKSFRVELAKLAKRINEFDAVYPGHSILGIAPSIVQDMLDLCDQIIADPDCNEYRMETFGSMGKLKVTGLASLMYADETIG